MSEREERELLVALEAALLRLRGGVDRLIYSELGRRDKRRFFLVPPVSESLRGYLLSLCFWQWQVVNYYDDGLMGKTQRGLYGKFRTKHALLMAKLAISHSWHFFF